MSDSPDNQNNDLKKKAKQILDHGVADSDGKVFYDDYKMALHELHVHQIELEMQNEELRKAQLELGNVRDQYANLFDFAPVGYIVLNSKNIITDANLTICKMLNINRLSLFKKGISGIISPESQSTFYQHMRQILDSKLKHACEVKLLRKDGSEFYAAFECVPQIDSQDNISGMSIAVIDISESKRLRIVLQESELLFKTIFNESMDGILLAEVDTRRFLMCNSAICKMLGYTKEELICLRVDDIHPKDALPLVIEQFERQATKKGNLAADLPVKRRDGSIFNADINVSAIILSGKKYKLESFRDITDRKKAENKIRAANTELTKLAFTDSLTGLTNRKPFLNLLDNSISRAERDKQKLALPVS